MGAVAFLAAVLACHRGEPAAPRRAAATTPRERARAADAPRRPRAAEAPPAPAPGPSAFSHEAIARGEVQALAFGAGELTIASGGGTTTLNATPDVLRALSPGEAVALPYRSFAGVPWVERARGDRWAGTWSVTGTLTGPVDAMRRARGAVAIGGRWLRAHPLLLAGVVPGERVTVAFVRVGGVDWVASLEAAPAGADAR